MSFTGCDLDLELLRAIFKGFLLDDLKNLKDLICCDGGAPAPGADIYVNNLTLEREAVPGSPEKTNFVITATRSDGKTFTITVPESDNSVEDIQFNETTRELKTTFKDGTSKTVIIPPGNGGGGGTPGVDTKVNGFTLEFVKLDTDRFELDGDVIKRNANKLTIKVSDGNDYDVTIPDDSIELLGVRDSGAKPNHTEAVDVLTTPRLWIAEYEGDKFAKRSYELPVYWTIPEVVGNKLKLTTKQYTPGVFASNNDNINQSTHVTDVYVKEIDLPAGSGGGTTLATSTSEPEKTTGTKLPTTMFGERGQVLGTPYKWVEFELDGETVLMPVWRKP